MNRRFIYKNGKSVWTTELRMIHTIALSFHNPKNRGLRHKIEGLSWIQKYISDLRKKGIFLLDLAIHIIYSIERFLEKL